MALVQSDSPDKECLKGLPPNLVFVGDFLLDSAHSLNWGDLSESIIMDVGCGIDSPKLFKTVFPKFYRVIALDISVGYIHYLKFYHGLTRMDYHVADITCRNTVMRWEGQICKLVSFYCFNCLTDQKSGFENIHYLLKAGGEAVILTALRNPHYQCAKYLLEKPKWKKFQHLERKFTDHQAHGTGISFYKKILKDLAFEVLLCTEDTRFISFPTEDSFRESDLTKDKVVTEHLPLDLQEEFKEEYVQALMTLNGSSPNGELCIRTSSAKIIVRKSANNIER